MEKRDQNLVEVFMKKLDETLSCAKMLDQNLVGDVYEKG